MTVKLNGYRAHETDCKVLSAATALRSKNYLAKFKCHGEGESWTENYRMSVDNKGRLIFDPS
jgi:hypothetical protein